MINVEDYNHVIHNKSPLIVEIFDFINEEENIMFFKTIKHYNFKKSMVVGDVNNPVVPSFKRTSTSFSLPLFISKFTEILTFRISELTDSPINKFDEFQVLKYEIDEKFSPHHDRFHSNDKNIIGSRGQRTATNILYLNDDYKGGNLIFPKLKLNIKPKKNSLVYFEYNDKNYDDTLHGSARITEGTKYAMTCWIHEGSYGDYHGSKNIKSDIEILKVS